MNVQIWNNSQSERLRLEYIPKVNAQIWNVMRSSQKLWCYSVTKRSNLECIPKVNVQLWNNSKSERLIK